MTIVTKTLTGVNSIAITDIPKGACLLWAELKYVSSSGAGNRAVVMGWYEGATLKAHVPATPVQAASLTRYYMWLPTSQHDGSFAGAGTDHNHMPLPGVRNPGNWDLKFFDNANIDNTNDAMTLTFQYEV